VPDSAEARIIHRALQGGYSARSGLLVPPGDDAAVLPDGWVLTTDHMVEGIHFDHRLSGADVGYKLVAVNVSDLAAMGARPSWALLNLAVPADDAWTLAFTDGLAEGLLRWGIDLIGGDTTRSPGPRFAGLTLAGRAPGPVLRRTGARAGDTLWTTGVPGLAALGYLLPDPPSSALNALRRPAPALEFVIAAAPWITACMDLSDGLRDDLSRLCAASGVGARVETAHLPWDTAFDLQLDLARAARLAGGDDYQLLFTARPEHATRLRLLAEQSGIRLSEIGVMTAGAGAEPTDGPWPAPPWTHFPERA
jgi:thiamine-monophosphate kinase